MHTTEPSRTAEFMAFFRALETARPASGRLFDDPLAIRFLRPSLRGAALSARVPGIGWALTHYIDRRWPGARSSGVARTRFIDDALDTALAGGFDQVVLLGAGFDSRAYRLPAASRVRVFEVDHPNTSRTKQQHIRALLGRMPAHVTFAAIDFTCERLDEILHTSGLDLARPVFFVWEGVSQYLDADAVDSTIRYVATAAADSKLLFTYVDSGALRPNAGFDGMAAINRALENADEPWTFGFDPAALPGYLRARGLGLISDLGAADYRALYADRTLNRAKGYEFYRIAVAEVLASESAE
jgi:methyltransferase (TIGR00027 family)